MGPSETSTVNYCKVYICRRSITGLSFHMGNSLPFVINLYKVCTCGAFLTDSKSASFEERGELSLSTDKLEKFISIVYQYLGS